MDQKDQSQPGGERRPSEMLEMREEKKPRVTRKKVLKEILEWVVSIAVALIAVYLIRTFLFTVIRVEGPSMKETLHDGDRMIVTIIDKQLYGAQRGDVVICHYPNREDQFVKRVVGVGGDMVEIRGGVLYLNDEAQDEPYVTHLATQDYGPQAVPEGHYLVMGDNRSNSHDGRHSDVGALSEDMIVGIARLIMWPPSDIGLIQ